MTRLGNNITISNLDSSLLNLEHYHTNFYISRLTSIVSLSSNLSLSEMSTK